MRTILVCILAAWPVGVATAAPAADPAPQVLERTDLAPGLVRERLLLPGWDPADPVPALAIYPKAAARLPLVMLFHWFRGSKEAMEPWARDLAPQGFFVVAPDLHLHGERSVKGMLDGPDLPALGEEFAVFVHQASIAHSARDFPVLLEGLRGRAEVDVQRVGVAGISMGSSLVMVLAWQEKGLGAAASLVGACDFWWDVTKIPPGPEQDAKKAGYSPRVRRLVESIDPWPRADRIAPTPLLVANGRQDGYIDIASVRKFAERLWPGYATAPDRLRVVEEDVGHDATGSMRREADAWLSRFLKASPASAAGPGAAEAGPAK